MPFGALPRLRSLSDNLPDCSPSVRFTLHHLLPCLARGAMGFRFTEFWLMVSEFRTAYSPQLSIPISFGGPLWPISLADLNLGAVITGRCFGAIFDITHGSNLTQGEGQPE